MQKKIEHENHGFYGVALASRQAPNQGVLPAMPFRPMASPHAGRRHLGVGRTPHTSARRCTRGKKKAPALAAGPGIRQPAASIQLQLLSCCYSTPIEASACRSWLLPLLHLLTWLCPSASSASFACRSALPRLTSAALPLKDSWLLALLQGFVAACSAPPHVSSESEVYFLSPSLLFLHLLMSSAHCSVLASIYSHKHAM